MHAAYIIAPPKKAYGVVNGKDEEEESSECMISFIAQVDPKGWIWQSCGYQQMFLREVMHSLWPRPTLINLSYF
jgi:hypothetical protein